MGLAVHLDTKGTIWPAFERHDSFWPSFTHLTDTTAIAKIGGLVYNRVCEGVTLGELLHTFIKHLAVSSEYLTPEPATTTETVEQTVKKIGEHRVEQPICDLVECG